jgi:methylglutaconyl-CoA hydratase
MTWQTIRLETDARGVATLTLNRPEKHNVLNAAMIEELGRAAVEINADIITRVVVLTGQGRSFCAGGDLEWMRAQIDAPRATRMDQARKLAEMLFALNTLDKPLIGRVQGSAYGGGVGLMAVCDEVVAVEGARFGLPETRLGLIPATISPYVIARMGEGRARQVFMSSRLFDAARARDLGLVARLVLPEGLDAAVADSVAPYFDTAPGAVTAAKRLARSLGPLIDGR